ncbi:lysophospholipid acyltransferase family protein [Aestuariicella sp. G3-2]|uniref:lysophospholipid acyltransferase family protein n=1 Tax=Pseudomaricurvus albidus TaxID=2842452 RepID=UPI001C0CF0BE|nr:lysophospholipid acyltransferase family protein [Aestuariicella albida]MBU3068702.1 lysophospholipid acyltransferase family protein [Aestuariicella albida]
MSDSPSSLSFKERVIVFCLKGSARLPLWLSRGLGGVLGWASCVCRNSLYRVTRENLELCFPTMAEAERKQLIRDSLIETGKMMLETGAVWMKDQAWLESKILAVHQREILDEALAEGRGVVTLAPHLGNWEVLGLYLSEVPGATFLYQPPEIEEVDRIIREGREKAGATVVPTNRRGVLALLKVMKAGGFTGILPDQVPDAAGGEFAPFYGVPALTMTLVNSLRERSGCKIIAAYAERVKGGFEIHFEHADERIYSEDTLTALTGLNKTVEKCVDAIPAQYQWEYKRFRKQPEGMPKLYKKKK